MPESDSSLISCSSRLTSRIVWYRRSGSLRRHRRIRRSSSRGSAGHGHTRRLGLRLNDGGKRIGDGRAPERPRTRGHLVEHRPEAEDVASRIDLAAAGLLGRHVRGRARDRAGRTEAFGRHDRLRLLVRRRLGGRQLCQPEVEDLHRAVAAHHHVGRLQVAMDDAPGMRGGQRVCHRNGDAQYLAEPHPLSRDQRVEALATHVLHDEEVDAIACQRQILRRGQDLGSAAQRARVSAGRSGARRSLWAAITALSMGRSTGSHATGRQGRPLFVLWLDAHADYNTPAPRRPATCTACRRHFYAASRG